MRLLLRLFVAFCVATVLAQGIILVMAGARGNIKKDTLFKGIALLNGIDISGDRLQKILDDYQQGPAPTYEDVRDSRAKDSLDLEMREEALARRKAEVDEKLLTLTTSLQEFERRVEEFYKKLDSDEANILAESLQDVKQILEEIDPAQAKAQLLKLYEDGQKEDVIAIIKAMPEVKRKKILGEFDPAKEADQLNEIIKAILLGEPTVGLIDEARKSAQP